MPGVSAIRRSLQTSAAAAMAARLLLILVSLIPATAQAQEHDLKIPGLVEIGPTMPGKCDSNRIEIRDTDTFYIAKVDPFISYTNELKLSFQRTAGSAFLTFFYCPVNAAPECLDTTITIQISNRTNPQFTGTAQIRVQGCLRKGELQLEPDTLRFGAVKLGDCKTISVRLRNVGGQPLTVEDIVLEPDGFSLADSDIFPIELAPGATRLVPVKFCPETEGTFKGLLQVSSEAQSASTFVALSGEGVAVRLDFVGTLNFKNIPFGFCDRITHAVTNRSAFPVVITGAEFHGGSGTSAPPFRLLSPTTQSFPLTLPPNARLNMTVQFCPDSLGFFHDTLTIKGDGLPPLTIELLGSGSSPRVSLGHASAAVGENARLKLRVHSELDPMPTNDALNIAPYVLEMNLAFDARSLFPVDIIPEGSTGTTDMEWSYDTPGLLTFSASDVSLGRLLSNDWEIVFRGLSTGKPENNVRIGSAAVTGAGPLTAAEAGVVLLSGCEVLYPVDYIQKARILQVGPNPAGNDLTIRYQSLGTTSASLMIYDLSGVTVMQTRLPATDLNQQREATLSLGRLSNGNYLMELRNGESRTIVPIVVGR